MNLHSVFLRKQCILPVRLHPRQDPCGENWTLVDNVTAADFYTLIRQSSWHFMWILGSCSRRSLGHTRETAIQRALERALRGISTRFNAAELVAVKTTWLPGFYIAKVTLEPRKIQQYNSLDISSSAHPQLIPTR